MQNDSNQFITYEQYVSMTLPQDDNIVLHDITGTNICGWKSYASRKDNIINGTTKDERRAWQFLRAQFMDGVYYSLKSDCYLSYMKIIVMEIVDVVMSYSSRFDKNRFSKVLLVLKEINPSLINKAILYANEKAIGMNTDLYWSEHQKIIRTITSFKEFPNHRYMFDSYSFNEIIIKLFAENTTPTLFEYKIGIRSSIDKREDNTMTKVFLAKFVIAVIRNIPTLEDYINKHHPWNRDYSTGLAMYISRLCANKLDLVISGKGGNTTCTKEDAEYRKEFNKIARIKNNEGLNQFLDCILGQLGHIPTELIDEYRQRHPDFWRKQMKEYNEELTTTGNIDDYLAKANRLAELALPQRHGYQAYIVISTMLEPLNKDLAKEYYLRACLSMSSLNCKSDLFNRFFPGKKSRKHLYAIIDKYKKDKDLQSAFDALHGIGKCRRRKIEIDNTLLMQKECAFHDTVDLLNEILTDEQVNQPSEAINIKTSSADRSSHSSSNILEHFASHNYTLSSSEMEEYARSVGKMASVLIDEVNETHFDNFDDNIIEQSGDSYILNEEYFKTLSI